MDFEIVFWKCKEKQPKSYKVFNCYKPDLLWVCKQQLKFLQYMQDQQIGKIQDEAWQVLVKRDACATSRMFCTKAMWMRPSIISRLLISKAALQCWPLISKNLVKVSIGKKNLDGKETVRRIPFGALRHDPELHPVSHSPGGLHGTHRAYIWDDFRDRYCGLLRLSLGIVVWSLPHLMFCRKLLLRFVLFGPSRIPKR